MKPWPASLLPLCLVPYCPGQVSVGTAPVTSARAHTCLHTPVSWAAGATDPSFPLRPLPSPPLPEACWNPCGFSLFVPSAGYSNACPSKSSSSPTSGKAPPQPPCLVTPLPLTSQPGLWDRSVGTSVSLTKPVPLNHQGVEIATTFVTIPGDKGMHTFDPSETPPGRLICHLPHENRTVQVAAPQRHRWCGRTEAPWVGCTGSGTWGAWRSSLECGVLACSPLSPKHLWLLVNICWVELGGR